MACHVQEKESRLARWRMICAHYQRSSGAIGGPEASQDKMTTFFMLACNLKGTLYIPSLRHRTDKTRQCTWGSGRLRWKRLRRACRARWPPLKAGQPHPCIISTSRMILSACFRQAKNPWIISTCKLPHSESLAWVAIGSDSMLSYYTIYTLDNHHLNSTRLKYCKLGVHFLDRPEP